MAVRFSLFVVALALLPSTARCEEPKPVELNTIRLYIPIPELKDRFGTDVQPLAKYVKALEKRAGEVLAREKQPKAKGLLIVAGFKSKKSTRIWCEAVDGDVPAEVLQLLEKELAKVEAVDVTMGPAAFAMEVNLFGQKPNKYPEFPQIWVEVAKKEKFQLLIPPDDLFKSIWPN